MRVGGPGVVQGKKAAVSSGRVARLGPAHFNGHQLKLPGRVVVLFQGPWCPFCRAFRPEYERSQPPPDVRLAEYVMKDFYEKVPFSFDIEVIPTVIAFENGQVSWRHSGIANRGLGEPTIHRIEKWGLEPRPATPAPSPRPVAPS